jgi:uncharacterized protein
MDFEFDPAKSEANRTKHGIDFVTAQELWQGETVEVPARTTDEPRLAIIGRIGGRHYTAIIARRGSRIRIISVRRSRDNERMLYEQT